MAYSFRNSGPYLNDNNFPEASVEHDTDMDAPPSPRAYSEAPTHDTIASLLDKINININPHCRLKLQKKIGNARLSMNFGGQPLSGSHQLHLALTMKPLSIADSPLKYLHKLELNHHDKATRLYTSKLRLGPFRLQAVAVHHWQEHRFGLEYRAKLFGALSGQNASTNYRRSLANGRAEVRASVMSAVEMPGLEGKIGGGEGGNNFDVGSVAIAVPKLDLVIKFDPPPPMIESTVSCDACGGSGTVTTTRFLDSEPSIETAPRKAHEVSIV